nr:HC-toxin synthetase [Colletotrichum truncatum]KAF6781329.1 HC-toxin synthetase [Colletotrichum truncatum]
MLSDLDMATVVGPTIACVPVRIYVDSQLQTHEFFGPESAASFTTFLIIQPDFESGFSNDTETIVETDNSSYKFYVDYSVFIECFSRSGDVTVKMLYDPAVLPRWDAEMMEKQFEQLLVQIAFGLDPLAVVADLRPLTHQQAEDILKFSCSDLTEHRECLHERVFAKAKAWEANDAVHGWDARYTYSKLQSTVKLLTPRLSPHLGGTAGKNIPICSEKSAAAARSLSAER